MNQGVRVVYASSSSVYGTAESYPLREDGRLTPVSPYGVSKLACESLASAYGHSAGLDAVGLRYFSVYGPRQRPDMAFAKAFESLTHRRPYHLLGDGSQSRDFTYVGDIVEATLRAMEHGTSGRAYNVGGGSEVSLLDALALCERIVGQPLDVHRDAGGGGRCAPHDRRHQPGRRPSWGGRPPRRWRMGSAPRPRASRCGARARLDWAEAV